jgi:hypothetical protein
MEAERDQRSHVAWASLLQTYTPQSIFYNFSIQQRGTLVEIPYIFRQQAQDKLVRERRERNSSPDYIKISSTYTEIPRNLPHH